MLPDVSILDIGSRLLCLFGVVLLCSLPAHADFLIASNGRGLCSITKQHGATPTEIHAASELVSTLEQMTGAKFEVTQQVRGKANASIIVGPGTLASTSFPDIDFSKLGSDEVIIRTKGNVLLLAGGRPRGTLYAVSRFLQQQCGVCWWAPWAIDIPQKKTLRIQNLNIREKPVFEYREPFWFPAFDGKWAARHYYNGNSARLTPELGGKISYKGFVHTFYSLVPPDKHFKEHPEWYSFLKGKRTTEGAQLCLTNAALRDFTVEQVRAWLKESPEASIVSISQNDWYGACECENCKAVDNAEGSHAGTMLAFVNYIAEKLGPEFPNVAFDTLAYQYTRKPPKTIKPQPNVIVRLCSIECNFAAPLEDASNAAFANDIRGWSKISNRLYIWDYVTNFAHYIQPHPNWFVLGPNVRFFRNHNVKGLFEQGAYQSHGAEMAEMRSWVLAQLLWNPNLDDNALINEFLNGYYSAPAARYIRQYLDLMRDAAKGYYLGIGSPPDAPFLKFATLSQAERLWQQAEAATRNDPQKLWRVQQGHLPVRYVWLARWMTLRREALRAGAEWLLPTSRKAVADEWLALATGPGPAGWSKITHLSEGGLTPQAFVARFAQDPPEPTGDPTRYANPPAPQDLKDIDPRTAVDVQDEIATLYREGDLAELRPDPLASDGAAVWMPGSHHEWAVQIPINKLPEHARSGKWKIYAVIRVQKKAGATSNGNAFTAGVYDTEARVSRGEAKPPTVTNSPEGYHSYLLGTVEVRPGQYLWAAPTANADVEAIWVDRFYMVPEKQVP